MTDGQVFMEFMKCAYYRHFGAICKSLAALVSEIEVLTNNCTDINFDISDISDALKYQVPYSFDYKPCLE